MMIRSAVLIQALCGLGCTPQVPGTSPHPDGTDDTEAPPLSDTGESVGSTSGATTPSPNYAVPGPYGFSTATGTHQTGGCQLAYTQFEPDELSADVTVVLTHGFMRNQGHMRGWAEHLATWGIRVLTPDLCHASVLDTDHVQNGLDLAALGAEMEGAEGTLYIGHSAGGLASVLAATGDDQALAVLGLDPVDNNGLGVDAASELQVPVRAVLGDASACNAQSNGNAMTAAAPNHQVLGIPGADHCSFESPTDVGCTLFCGGDGAGLTAEDISDTVAALATAYVLWQSEANPTAADWWTPSGSWYEQLISAGRIVSI